MKNQQTNRKKNNKFVRVIDNWIHSISSITSEAVRREFTIQNGFSIFDQLHFTMIKNNFYSQSQSFHFRTSDDKKFIEKYFPSPLTLINFLHPHLVSSFHYYVSLILLFFLLYSSFFFLIPFFFMYNNILWTNVFYRVIFTQRNYLINSWMKSIFFLLFSCGSWSEKFPKKTIFHALFVAFPFWFSFFLVIAVDKVYVDIQRTKISSPHRFTMYKKFGIFFYQTDSPLKRLI